VVGEVVVGAVVAPVVVEVEVGGGCVVVGATVVGGTVVAVVVDGASVSRVPADPAGRPNSAPVAGSLRMRMSTGSVDTWMTMMTAGVKPGQGLPVYFVGPGTKTGSASGLPHLQRARGTPNRSTNTPVPACSTTWRARARPFSYPKFVTRVSARSSTGVSPRMNVAISPTGIRCAEAQAAALSGFAARKPIIFSASHTWLLRVPP
jgi:hypothetical protein